MYHRDIHSKLSTKILNKEVKKNYSRFSLFMELKSHKVTTNTKLANTEPHVVRVLDASSYNIFINKSKHKFILCTYVQIMI